MTDTPWQRPTEQADRLQSEEGFCGIVRVTRGDRVLWESCQGLADRAAGVPVGPDTAFATASLSKMFTAVAVLDAAGRGEVALGVPVVDLLPPAKRPSTLRPDVTVHHLLSHTSGIADYFEEDEDLPGYQEDYAALWTTRAVHSIREDLDLLPLFADLPPVGPPGTAYHYSNAGYVLLGILLSQVTGLPFGEAVRTRVLEPAGMTRSGYPAADEVHPGLAVGYLPPAAPGGPWRTNVFSVPAQGGGDGGAVVTAGDLERFLRAVHRGGVWRGVAPADVLTPRVATGETWLPAYGVEVRVEDGAFAADGADPGVATFARYLPASDTTIVLLSNTGWEQVDGLADLLNSVVDAVSGTA